MTESATDKVITSLLAENTPSAVVEEVRQVLDELRTHPRFEGRLCRVGILREILFSESEMETRLRFSAMYSSALTYPVFDFWASLDGIKIWHCHTTDSKLAILALDRIPLD